ncbi:MAG: DUF1232 domain-containing protein [Deltaproteobacteria bacterium]|nr:DUF1232 domain-containing protein [Deltaproteobacteria bacterium]
MLKTFFVAASGIIALLYLLNPGMGIFELMPDSLPLVGNLDEAAAAAVLIAALRYFGFDSTRFFSARRSSPN